jgi:hypothetical protein
MNAYYPVEIVRYLGYYIYCNIHPSIIYIFFQDHRMHDMSRFKLMFPSCNLRSRKYTLVFCKYKNVCIT